ncbi:MAG: YbhB/YbcL family Raf kinase inhibitor-like protein [Vicinamibacterales bacterium]
MCTRQLVAVILVSLAASPAEAQTPPAGGATQRPGQPGGAPPQQQGRRNIEAITLSSPAWPDGGMIPIKHSQAGDELSPPLSWTAGPETTASYMLIVHDIDAAIGNGADDILHWMLWNIPASARGLAEGQPHGNQLPDGTRQISASGPYYRGPGAAAAGSPHHYVFELYALDVMLDVPAVGASPPQTRAAVMAAMAGHVRGKGVYVGLFKR